MYTATSKQILEPVAEAISTLIIFNVEAESKNAPMPDLTDVAKSVANQAKQLTDAGKSMITDPGDEQLKKEITAACAKVEAGATALIETCAVFKKDPYDKASRSKLVESAKLILQGTAEMLNAQDDSEVRKIVGLCHESRDQLKQLKTITGLDEMLKAIRPFSQILVELTAFAKNRVAEIIYPALQARLRDDVENITQLSGLLLSSSKAVAAIANENTVKSRDLCCDQFIEIINDVATVVQIREWSESAYSDLIGSLAAKRSQIHKQMVSVMTNVQAKDIVGLKQSLEQFSQTSAALVKNSSDVILFAQPRNADQELKIMVANIEKQQKDIVDTANKCIKTPDNIGLQQQLYDKLNEASGLYTNLESTSDKVAAVQLNNSIQSGASDKLAVIAKKGQPADYKLASESFSKEASDLQSGLKQASLLTQDVETYRAIRVAEKDLTSLAGQVILAGKAVNEQPTVSILSEHFEKLTNAWKERKKLLEKVLTTDNAVFKPEDLIAAERHLLNNHLQTLEKALKEKDRDGAENAKREINSSVKRLVDSAQREQGNIGNNVQKKNFEKTIQELASTASDLIQSKNNEKDVETKSKYLTEKALAVENILRNQNTPHNKPNQSVSSVLPPPNNGFKEKITAPSKLNIQTSASKDKPIIIVIDGEEVEIVDSPEPEGLSAEEAKQNPLKAAATELKVVSSQWTSAANPFIKCSSAVASKLERLAEIYREDGPNHRKEMIDKAREILNDGQQFVADCKQAADSCGDSVLRNQLLKSLETIQTMTVQLKIISAVKAAEPRDKESERQIVLISQNLVNAYKTALKAMESASIRAHRVPRATVPSTAIKFRKVMYTRLKNGEMSPKFMAVAARNMALAGVAA